MSPLLRSGRDPLLAGPAHPLALATAALILVNDFALRGYAPAWLTGKLSDAGWLVVAPVVLAALLAGCGLRSRVAALSLLATAAFYSLLQTWPPLGAWFGSGHVADAGDLLMLPALLGALAVWRWPRATRLPGAGLVALPLLAGTLLADVPALVSEATWPCGDGMRWDPAQPLRLQLDGGATGLMDTDAFLRGMRLVDGDGVERALVAGNGGSWQIMVCARDGLEPDTAYTWEVGPWAGPASNEVVAAHDALPTVHFVTTSGQTLPAADPASCVRLASDLPDEVFTTCDPFTPVDTEDTAEIDDTGDPGDTADTEDAR
jgi:hypothetical protein